MCVLVLEVGDCGGVCLGEWVMVEGCDYGGG